MDNGEETFGADPRVEVEALRGQVAGLSESVAALRAEIAELKRSAAPAVGDGDVSQECGYIEVDRSAPRQPVIRFRADRVWQEQGKGPMRPFDIRNDPESGEWKIYLPEGCVQVEGNYAYCDAGTDGMLAITPALTIWGHVDPESGGRYRLTIDGDDTQASILNFRIADFSSDLTRVAVQYVNSCMWIKRDRICGDDSNITFTEYDGADNDKYGKTLVDVYYL